MVIIGDKNIKEFVGTVVSSKMDKSLVVEVKRIKKMPLYKKRYAVKKKFYVHDENNEAKEWDLVTIRECRPLSKQKRFKLISVNNKDW